ncbi:MAG: single-stranded DNA-binding protein [Spirochaetales bacterium]|nr:single-stranded DNA-binding protein [Spirochaetales bacterium]
MKIAAELIDAAGQLALEADACSFSHPVAYVYNPLSYAWKPYVAYVENFATTRKKVLFLGMNPGPWGMAQTGVPFGEVSCVRNWLGITEEVATPRSEHPKRRVTGFSCTRSEVSGRRLWSFFSKEFSSPEAFFSDHFVTNYCPLMFMEESGRNRTPDKLPSSERAPLFEICDRHLVRTIKNLKPDWLIGIGAFAESRLSAAATAEELRDSGSDFRIGKILHPSPANPAANKDWERTVKHQLRTLGVW